MAVTRIFAGAIEPRGPAAREIDDLWMLMLLLGVGVFVLVIVVLVVASRRDGDGERSDETEQSRMWLFGGGVLLPAAGVSIVLIATLVAMRDTEEAGASEVVVEVVGHQWWWEFHYPGAGTTATELHIPAGEPVELQLTSADVIHSFWVPELAGKLDALPEDVNVLVIEADEPGRYRGKCAEFCGLHHASMDLVVVAHSPSDFATWLDEQAAPAVEPSGARARRGAELFRAEECGECHTVRGTAADGERGPDLTHVASRDMLAGGRLRGTADDMAAWIHDPDEFKEGVDMPASPLSDEDVEAIVSYLQELE